MCNNPPLFVWYYLDMLSFIQDKNALIKVASWYNNSFIMENALYVPYNTERIATVEYHDLSLLLYITNMST